MVTILAKFLKNKGQNRRKEAGRSQLTTKRKNKSKLKSAHSLEESTDFNSGEKHGTALYSDKGVRFYGGNRHYGIFTIRHHRPEPDGVPVSGDSSGRSIYGSK